ncbi:CPBP family intramembrane glutamic endopeptidase [Spirochaeta dissipatitropha]
MKLKNIVYLEEKPLQAAIMTAVIHLGLMVTMGFFLGVVSGITGELGLPYPSWLDGFSIVASGGIAVWLAFRFLSPDSVFPDLKRRPVARDWVMAGFFALLAYFLSLFAAIMLAMLPFIPQESNVEMLMELMPKSMIVRLLLMAVCVPIIEEILYRGVVLGQLVRKMRPGYAVLVSAVIFGAIHLDPFQSLYTFFLGLFLGWFYLRTRNLRLTIWIHVVFNSYGLLISELQLEQYGEEVVLMYTLIFLLVVGITGAMAVSHFRKFSPET